MTIGLVVFSFALRSEEEEPNPCNRKLAYETQRLFLGEDDKVVIVAQWEVAKALGELGVPVVRTVYPPADGSYLDSKGVWEEAKSEFRKYGIVHPDTLPGGSAPSPRLGIIPVANPFLHLTACKRMMRADGYNVLDRKIGWIGFDASKQNTQWWTRGPIRLLFYAVRQKFTGLRGHGGKQTSG